MATMTSFWTTGSLEASCSFAKEDAASRRRSADRSKVITCLTLGAKKKGRPPFGGRPVIRDSLFVIRLLSCRDGEEVRADERRGEGLRGPRGAADGDRGSAART